MLYNYDRGSHRKCKTRDCYCKKIQKLYDHVNLDVARINYMRTISEKSEHNNKILSYNLQKTKGSLVELEKNLESANIESQTLKDYLVKSLDKSKREYITILGIFAALVITFVSGIAFSSSVLGNMDKVTIYRLVLTILLLGTVVGNWIAILTRFIRDLSLEEDKVPRQWHDSKTTWFNVVMFIFMIFLLTTWAGNIVLKRNDGIITGFWSLLETIMR